MSLKTSIKAGSVTLTRGGLTIVGLDTTFAASGAKAGDSFQSNGLSGKIASVEDDTNLTLELAWAGIDGAAQTYLIDRRGDSTTIVSNQVKLEYIIARIEAGYYPRSDGDGTLAERSEYDAVEKSFVYRVTNDASGFLLTYLKASDALGDWAGPFSNQGEKGEQGQQGMVGESFDPKEVGPAAKRVVFDAEAEKFSFLDTENFLLYFKLSSASGDWSTGIPFGKGDKGDTGAIAIGDVATGDAGTDADVVNSGTPTDAVLDFTIPRGDRGYKGWAPVFSLQADGIRRVLKVSDWVGGEDAKPAIGDYVGLTGLVPDIADAIDVRGEPGTSNSTGDMFQSVYDLTANGKVDVAEYAETVDWDSLQNKVEETALIYGGYN